MADAITLAKSPQEKISQFNARLLETCNQVPITSAQLVVVDGQPLVTLFSEMVEATEEDVQEATEAGEELKEGELIPAEEPVFVQVCGVRADTTEHAQKTQERMGTLYARADGAVTAVLHAAGKGFVTSVDDVTKKPVTVLKDVFYAMVVYNPSDDDEDEGQDGEGDQS